MDGDGEGTWNDDDSMRRRNNFRTWNMDEFLCRNSIALLFYTESRHEARNLSERETTVEINRNFCCYFAFDIQGSLKF